MSTKLLARPPCTFYKAQVPRGVGRRRREDLAVVVVVEGRCGAHMVPPLLLLHLLRLRGGLLGRPTSVLKFHTEREVHQTLCGEHFVTPTYTYVTVLARGLCIELYGFASLWMRIEGANDSHSCNKK